MIDYSRDGDGVVTLTLDDPDQQTNTMNAAYVTAMTAAVDRLHAERDEVTGVIVTSAKKTFFAGGDLPSMARATPADAPALFDLLGTIKRDFRRLETYGRPVVAAINGAALGGGLEVALACHHRIALDTPDTRLGFPEVTLGLLPGAGGVTRTVRLLGLVPALTTWLLTGRRLRPADALAHGLVDALAATPAELLSQAREWIFANPDAAQPWDRDGYRLPGGTPSSPALAAQLPAFPATLRGQLKGASLPAPEAILATAVEGAQVDFDTAQVVETRRLITLLTGQVAKNLIGALFFDMRAVNGGLARPDAEAPPARRVAVLGAGMMGAGIAAACARAGLEVVVKDVTAELAARAAQPGVVTTADVRDLAGCDVVIEAVFEDPALKRSVFAEVEPVLAPDALLASNTSTLPVTGLAAGVSRPRDFLGMHFFSPVARMPLLEIVVGEHTSEAAVARAFDLGRRLGKTPIVVDDGRGFFTSRVIGHFLDEAIGMLTEGVPAPSIEHAALQAGYPTGPLALADEVSLTLIQRIGALSPGSLAVVNALVDDHDRPGRSAGRGFYSYAASTTVAVPRRVGLWEGLAPMATAQGRAVPLADLQDRFLFAEALDARRCLAEGVLRTAEDGNVGSILGIGYPAWTGGVLRFADQHPDFAGRARELAARYGSRFEPA
ncbi:3-hydroxyacyl-CoA dehydrogenase NAD-binding domain-containing protein [Actinoplanes sp. URMC 104]|uniref:3-hydroxyacyl-CoA dehydrogenase NAD-binding domain-containing protein n=1 Tax=Actinoplanes sp. URMC 104 TaxID=3423409 RepID=UPI003F19BFD7